MRARRRSGRKSHGRRFASSTSEPQAWSDERLARREAGDRRRKPVRVHDVGAPGAPARRPRERGQEQRQQQHPPGARPQVVRDPVAVGDAEVAEGIGRDDGHLDARALELDDGVPHEAARDVTRVARVRRRQDADLHDGRSRRANTAGATIASIARTKK